MDRARRVLAIACRSLAIALFLSALTSHAAAPENRAMTMPRQTFWGYWNTGPFDPGRGGAPMHVTVCGPLAELDRVTIGDPLPAAARIPSTDDQEARVRFLLSVLAQTHPWYAFVLENQASATFFQIAIEPAGAGYAGRTLLWPRGLDIGVVTASAPPDTVPAVRLYTGTQFAYAGGRNLIDRHCTPLELVGDRVTGDIAMPFADLLCRRSGIAMPRGILAVPRHPAGLPRTWRWTRDSVTGVVWLRDGHAIHAPGIAP